MDYLSILFSCTNCLCIHAYSAFSLMLICQSVKVREILCVNGECNCATAGPEPVFKGAAYRYILKTYEKIYIKLNKVKFMFKFFIYQDG